ncbi:MAG: EAL domain-containing protein [Gammaproteobacteria bacterium]|jgi:diguanylate cyclase (GGDEF)-like protein|nr:EAL domain-containing protein [Gammaproteobacteria bacterium]
MSDNKHNYPSATESDRIPTVHRSGTGLVLSLTFVMLMTLPAVIGIGADPACAAASGPNPGRPLADEAAAPGPGSPAAVRSPHSAHEWLGRFAALAAAAPAQCAAPRFPTVDNHAPARTFMLSAPPDQQAEPLIATIKDPIVERFIVLTEDADGCIHSAESGRTVPFDWRSVLSPFPNAQLPQPLGATPSVAIVIDHKSVRPWIDILPRDRFQCLSERLWVALGMFTGMLATLFIVGLLVARYHPSGIVWAYLAYIVALQLYQVQALGLGAAWIPFWPPPSAHHLLQALAAGTAVIGMALPVITFLRPRGYTRAALIIGVALSASGFYLSALDAAAYRFGAAVLPVLAAVVIALLIKRLRTPDLAMRWFAIGLVAALTGGGMQAAAVALQGAWLPPISAFAFPIGNVVESICWLIAILLRLKGDQVSLHRRLIFEAQHDALTGMYSRAYMHERLAQAISDASDPSHGPSGLLYIDIGSFKRINDRFGQAIGDQVLREFAAILNGLELNADAIGRYGGDEFAVLMSWKAHWSHTEGAAVTLLGRFREPLEIANQRILVRPDIGVVQITAEYSDVDELIQDANRALRLAKQLGGRRATQFEPQMREQAQTEQRAFCAVEEAIRAQRLALHYQPVVQLEGFAPIGFEALLRWPQSDSSAISIQQVLAIAEGSGLLSLLSRHIVEMALAQIGEWQRQGVWSPAYFVSINVCERQLVDGSLLDELHTGLQHHGIDASAIRLEVSERSLGTDVDWSHNVLPRLLNQHILLGIDNFGAGLASLTTLTDLQPDYIKIDRSLIASLATFPRAQSLTRAGRTLAHDIGALAIAEGVETMDQLETLHELGIEYGQGQLIAAPMSGADTASWIQLADRSQDTFPSDGPSERHQLH